MPKPGPRAVRQYSDEVKLTAIRLTYQSGLLVKTVATALAIHPSMLSKWRKDVRDGLITGKAPKAPPPGPTREFAQLQSLERKYAEVQEDHELLKMPSGSVSIESRHLCVHETQCAGMSVAALCRRYHVTRAGFHAARRRGESAHHQQNRDLSRAILRVFRQHQGRYGSPRVWRVLQTEGWVVSRRRIAQLMRGTGLRAAVRGCRAKVNSSPVCAPPESPAGSVRHPRDSRVVGDITFLRVDSGWRYLAIVMDQYSQRILGWTLTRRRTSAVVCRALNKAAAHRPTRGVIFHSDRGSEYTGAPFGDRLVALGLQQSANVRRPGDNTHAESFFHTLKAELTRGVHFATDRHSAGTSNATCSITTRHAYTLPFATSHLLRLHAAQRNPSGVNKSEARSRAIFGSSLRSPFV